MSLFKKKYRDDRHEGQSFWTPERKLLVGVLRRAIMDYVSMEEDVSKEAGEWIFSDLSELPADEYTFPWICEHLGIDAELTAAAIRKMPKQHRLLLRSQESGAY